MRCPRTLFPVAHILRMRRRSEITASIVHTIVVDMVGHLPVSNFYNFLVHVYQLLVSWLARCLTSEGVKAVSPFLCEPFVFSHPFIIAGVDLCVFGLGHGYQPKRIAIAHPTVKKYKANNRALEQNQNVEDYLDVTSLRRMKSEALNPEQIRISKT